MERVPSAGAHRRVGVQDQQPLNQKKLVNNRDCGSIPIMKVTNPSAKATVKRITLGLDGFAKISAVEGISLKTSSKRMFAEFEKRGMSAEQRRRAITEKHTKKA